MGAVDTLIGDIVPPDALMKTLTDRKLAEQERVTYETQRLAQVVRQQFEQANALAVTQAKVVDAERQVAIADFNAQASVKSAEGQARAKTISARDSDQGRHEAVVAVSMHRRGEPDDRGPYAALLKCGRRLLGLSGEARGLWGLIFLGCRAARESSATPEVTSSGRSEPTSTAPSDSMARWSSAQFSANFEKSWLKAAWITASDWAAPLFKLSKSASEPRWTRAPA